MYKLWRPTGFYSPPVGEDRGREILVAQGFRPAAVVTLFCGHKKTIWQFLVNTYFFCGSKKLFKIYYHIPHDMEMRKFFVKVLLKFKEPLRNNFVIFVDPKT